MAKFQMELPTQIVKEIEQIYDDCDTLFGKMTKAGAELVESKVKSNFPEGLKGSNIEGCLKISRTYKTPTDGGINTKVMIDGYFLNEDLVKTPAPLVANLFEYGSRKRNYPKRPFFRKSFNKKEITEVMLKEQKKLSGGLLKWLMK